METRTSTLCRCCASEGPSKDLINKYIWMGEEEVYSDMLKECFDISLTMESQNEQGICELCITQLRNAFNFKKQVLFTDKEFRKNLSEEKPFQVEIKQEAPHSESGSEAGAGDVPFNDDDDDDGSGSDYEPLIKKEEEEKPKKRQAKVAAVGRPKRAKTEPATSKRPLEYAFGEIKRNVNTMNETKKSKAQRTKVANNDTATKNISKRKTLKNSGQESKLVKENLSIILSHSNATPIVRTVRDTMYRCAYCLQDFDMPKELKNHISSTHQNDLLLYLNRFNSLYNMCANLDVTDLKCRLCHDKCKLVEDLLSHLSVQHSIHTDKDVTNRMFQFDFSTADLNCVNCGSNFHSFKSLLEHMNKHSRNFICEDCGASYVTVSKLLTHQKYTHDIGTYPCDECGLVFDTISKRINHKKRHLAPMPKHKCQYCSQKFFLISECRKHAMEVHEKAVVNTAKCPACDAAFSTMSAMSRHKRKVHLMERNNVCQFCNMAFFSKLGLKHHMIKHTGAKDFECQVCHKKYGRKSTLQAHMRIHMNDRRFKCDKCGLAFVQKCSWKSHMRSKHNEMV